MQKRFLIPLFAFVYLIPAFAHALIDAGLTQPAEAIQRTSLDQVLERGFWVSQLGVLIIVSIAAFAALWQVSATRLFELLKFVEDKDFRDARRIVYFKIGNQPAGRDWWNYQPFNNELEKAAAKVCAVFDILGITTEPRRFSPTRVFRCGVGWFYARKWANSIVQAHDILEPYIAYRRTTQKSAYCGFTRLCERARPYANIKAKGADDYARDDALKADMCKLNLGRAERWIALGTWALALVTIWVLLDNKRAMELGQRAYIYAQPGNVYNVSTGLGPEPRIVIGNSGRTFAKNVKIYAGVAIRSRLSPNEEAALGRGEEEEGTLVLSPRVEQAIIRRAPQMTENDARGVSSNAGTGSRIYVFGRIEYGDIFDGRHHAEFCFVYYGEMANFPSNGGLGYASNQVRYCDKHNDAD
ncbi:MAG TPA: hypothetical protein VN832_11560 [Stellaceae bacterium]|nr:hypothetical protein [Stellaceae bacterium]